MDSSTKPIAIVQGAESGVIQQLLREFVERERPSRRIVGVIEQSCDVPGRTCGPGTLQNIADGCNYSLFQDLGEGSASCSLDPAGVILASEAVRRDIAAGCDLVVLSKFGKLEAENRSGLIAAFVTALETGVPILTSVSPKYAGAWESFAAPLFVTLPAEARAIDQWWCSVQGASVQLSYDSAAS